MKVLIVQRNILMIRPRRYMFMTHAAVMLEACPFLFHHSHMKWDVQCNSSLE
jgi:hypothetical protein